MALFRKKKSGGPTYTLQDAVRRGLVTFKVRGVREGDPSQIRVVVTKLVDEPMTIVVPKGTEFVPTQR